MTTNLKLDVDADGIALVTWDAPERSMNVVFFDASGEQLYRKEDLGRFGKFLYVASGIIVVLSPGIFPGLQSVADPGEPSIRLSDSSDKILIDGRTTAIDFGSVAQGGTPPQQGYTDQQWRDYVDGNDKLAKNYLSYAKSLKR